MNLTVTDKAKIDLFHDLYYNGLPGEGYIFQRTLWMNVPCQKCPLDLWIYQELIAELRPDLIVETGTAEGGSALFMAHMLDLVGKGEIVTIDIRDLPRPAHPRIKYVLGSSSDPGLIQSLLGSRPPETRLVILDSDHRKNHVLKELTLLAPCVSIGSYVIVEDTKINGHPVFSTFGAGPFEAVQELLPSHPEFMVDDSKEKFLLTFSPGGYLKRVG
jgi:cephalosporin hydroxylase